jgi:hypothetical protein
VCQERLGPSHFFTPLVLGPLNSLVWYVPSLRYTRGLVWRMHCGAEVTDDDDDAFYCSYRNKNDIKYQ